nr:MAG TPA: contryphan [Caudoviricetes sp.]
MIRLAVSFFKNCYCCSFGGCPWFNSRHYHF